MPLASADSCHRDTPGLVSEEGLLKYISQKFLQAYKGLLVSLALAVLVACGSAGESTGGGELTIRYFGASKDYYQFEMSNGSSRKVFFGAFEGEQGITFPSFSAVCEAQDSNDGGGGIFVGPINLFRETQRIIELPSGNALRLTVPKADFTRHAGERCDIQIMLEDRRSITSNKFTP